MIRSDVYFIVFWILVIMTVLIGGIKLKSDSSKFSSKKQSYSNLDRQIICLDGVAYYHKSKYGHNYLAVKYNKETLKPERCEIIK